MNTATDELRVTLLTGIRAFEGSQFGPTVGSGAEEATEAVAELDVSRTGGYPGNQVTGFGRPFLVDGAPRLAPTARRGDWAEPVELDLTWLDRTQREELGRRWTEAALLEHASVAAFARFSLELLGVGAPWNLVRRSQRAMAEELAHAEWCFGVASCFFGRPIGPGPLPLHAAKLGLSLVDVVRAAFLEGCIGETVAALEAEWASERVAESTLQSLLATIAQEERAHADLAFRFVTWSVGQSPEVAPLLVELGRTALAEVPTDFATRRDSGVGPVDREQWLADYGILSDDLREDLRLRALTEVVAPCLARVLGVAGRPPVVAA